ncbi:hypothetical protein FM996_06165 [Methylosinus sporium]|uniref:Uncharacterized protein n=1 Tax=Methylosinus sporium TaxID=428 RepID=A0A549T2L8_METSR|nr:MULTISPECIES: hypothetical protein [Methylosinus]MBU3890060.1 hypothetical protein [Methylosinus sp. KRF6]TRL36101.1 hypothetical protein FM996_06165 [Methylosinus sporium]
MQFFRRHARIISAILLDEFGLLMLLLFGRRPLDRQAADELDGQKSGSADPTKTCAYDMRLGVMAPIPKAEQFMRDQATELIVEMPAKLSLTPKKSDLTRE